MLKTLLAPFFCFLSFLAVSQNRDPLKAEIITTDIQNFWTAFNAARPEFKPEVFQTLYLNPGTKGLKSFMHKIGSAEYLAKTVASRARYYQSIRPSLDSIPLLKEAIQKTFIKLKELYPKAKFPPVYFVVGAFRSGGTSTNAGLILGAEMYGRTPESPLDELNDWQKSVIKPVHQLVHIVAHELIHEQQGYDGGNLLAASIKEGAADFIAELISGDHINGQVHAFANPIEKELWLEFKERMHKEDYSGWLYSGSPGRPNDLGYWMGYQITKAYYDRALNKQKAIDEIINIRDFDKFLAESRYAEKFN